MQTLLREIERHDLEMTSALARQRQILPASDLTAKGQLLTTRMGQLKRHAVSKQEQLTVAVAKVDKYKEEVVTLTRLIGVAQLRLRAAPVADSSVDGLRQQLVEHNVCMAVT